MAEQHLIEGIHFLIADGKVRPIVRGGEGPEPVVIDTPPVDAPVDAPTDAAPADPEPVVDPTLDWPEDARSLVTKLKDENVRYKERFRPWEQASDGISAEDQTFYREFLDDVKSGDPDRLTPLAGRMRTTLDTLSPAQQEALADATEAAAAEADDFDPYDKIQLDARISERAEALFDERQKAAEAEREVADWQTKIAERAKVLAVETGITGMGDPTSAAHATLLWVASRQFSHVGDPMERLNQAAGAIRDERMREAQALLKTKAADAATPASPPEGQEPSGRKPPLTMQDAAKAAAARVEAVMRGEVGT